MAQAAEQLQNWGYEVIIPNPREGEVAYDTLDDKTRAELKDGLIREHLHHINKSDAIFVFNEDKNSIEGYVGGNTLMEMAFAFSQGIEIFLLKEPTGVSYLDELLGMKPIILKESVRSIHEYFEALPRTYVSSSSPIKQRAVSRALRRGGIHTTIVPYPTSSGISEQPLNIDETYEGAMNRHAALQKETKELNAIYLATIESGLHKAHKDHNSFECVVTIVEKIGKEKRIGISMDMEYPREMTDKVPTQYPDIGALVKAEYGTTLKDAHPIITNGKITRLNMLENALYTLVSQLSDIEEK